MPEVIGSSMDQVMLCFCAVKGAIIWLNMVQKDVKADFNFYDCIKILKGATVAEW